MSGCLIAVLVCAALAIPTIGILAAIALPAYNDYVQRAKIMEVMAAVRPLQLAVREHVASDERCPDNDSADLAPLLQQLSQSPRIASVRVGTLQSGRCAFEITLRGVGVQNDGKTLLFEASDDDASQWDCSGGDLPARARPQQCRTSPNATSTCKQSRHERVVLQRLRTQPPRPRRCDATWPTCMMPASCSPTPWSGAKACRSGARGARSWRRR